jgi:DNA-binding beta-propeller fold protein YncE
LGALTDFAGRIGGQVGTLGVLVLKKCDRLYAALSLSLGALFLALGGCGSSSTNVVSIVVSPSVDTVIVSQSLTLTGTVSGNSNTNISSWSCQYQTSSVSSAGSSATGALQPCTAATGNIPANSNSLTVTFTAPSQVPNPTQLPGNNCSSSSQSCSLAIIITATAAADTKKTGTSTLTLDSGIVVSLTPATATVPTGEQQPFSVTLTNDLQNQGVTWLVTQGTPTTTVPYPSQPTCSTLSPSCGSISSTGPNTATFTAPSSLPTTATLTVVATSKADTTRYAFGTITIIQGGPITFNSVSPTIAPQGASFYNLFLDAPFISSSSIITLTPKSGGKPIVINSSSNQFKVLFPIPTTTVTTPSSTGARVLLTADILSVADTYTVTVSDPAQPVTQGAGPFSFQIVPVRPTSVASIPDSISQNGSGNELNLSVDGGYFGTSGNLANTTFNGNSIPQNSVVASSSRQLNLAFPTSAVNSTLPGLYPLSVGRSTPPLPAQNNPSVTNIAVYPDFSTQPPFLQASSAPVPAGVGPSAVDIDTKLGVMVVAETGSNLVQFFGIGNNSLTPLPCPTSSCAVNAPTGLSINQTNHTVAVVSPQDQSVVVLPFPGSLGSPGVSYPLTVSLAGLVPSNFTPLPLPYSVGVDGDTNMAVVAFTSSATPTTAKVGYLLDLNHDSQQCLAGAAQSNPPCVHAQVTLNTGTYPQVAMVPHSHLAYVTPGGQGTISGIDVTQSSSQLAITSVTLISGLVTVTVNVPSGQTLGINPGNPGSVLIQGVPLGSTSNTNFNGVFSVQSVLNTNSFTYALNSSVNDSANGNSSSFVYFSNPNLTIGVSQTAQGIAINPITRTAAVADANATGTNSPQIDLLNSTDQQVTSIIFNSGCTSAMTTLTCPSAPELLGTSSVAFQPYANLLVSYNPQQNQVSISDPVRLTRTAFVCNLNAAPPAPPTPPSPTCLPNPANTTQQQQYLAQTVLNGKGTSSVTVNAGGASTTLTLFGGVAVDPVTNQAFIVQSGSGQIWIINLGPSPTTTLKTAQITELQVPTVSGALIGGIAGALLPQGTLTSTSDLANVQLFGSGFDSSTQVRLDGTAIPSGDVSYVSNRVLKFTVPASLLSAPHRYAVDVVNGSGVRSNVTDFFVIKAVNMTSACSGGSPQPNSVAIADQLPGQGFSPIAVVSNSGCGNVAVIDINPTSPTFGGIKSTIATGTDPQGVAISSRLGLAVVANNTDGTASILNLLSGTQAVAAVPVGSTPTGVAINEDTGAALVANTGANTVSEIDLALLSGSSPATTLTATSIGVDQSPIAVAIDPDRGTNNQGLAVVTALQLVSGAAPIGVLDAIDIGLTVPAKSTTASVGDVTATPTGVVFDPSVSPALFYATSSGGNVVTTFNPDTGSTSSVHVGINPTSLALNPQTGGIMTVNTTGQTVSIIDTNSNPFTTRSTFGLGGSPQFGVAIDQFTNLAVLADQANNRVLIFPMPN